MTRANYDKHAPELVSKLRAATRELEKCSLDQRLRTLVETRVSQMNHCSYCIALHTKEALHGGEAQERMEALPMWRESPLFTAREKSALHWAESLTLISDTHAPDEDYAALAPWFSEVEIVELSLAISLANFWNRMAGGFKRVFPKP